jgi:hypothetical protein
MLGFPPTWAVWLLAGLLIAATLASTLAAGFAWRAAWPAGVRRLCADLRERMDALEIEWRKTKGELAVDVENLEELEQSIERKRARTATAAARLGGADRPAQDMSQAELKRLARARGFQV